MSSFSSLAPSRLCRGAILVALVSAAAALLAACSGGSGGPDTAPAAAAASAPPVASATGKPAFTAQDFSGDIESLAPYRAALSRKEVRGFLGKTAFGGDARLVALGTGKGLDALVEDMVDCPLQLWATPASLGSGGAPDFWGNDGTWQDEWLSQMFSGCRLREKLALDLDNWFAQRFGLDSGDWRNLRKHVEGVRTAGLGNFRVLVQAQLDSYYSAMWLNNATRFGQDPIVRRNNPDINFARELFELGLLGTFDAATGDANYTTRDLHEAARALSGYHEVVGPTDAGGTFQPRSYVFDPAYWDGGEKTVFEGKPWQKTAAFKPAELVDYVLYKVPPSANYIAAKYFSLIVGRPPTQAMAEQLGKQLRDADFDVKPMLRTILKSSAMFAPEARNACIKSPLEQMLSTWQVFTEKMATPFRLDHGTVWSYLGATNQRVADHDDVFGRSSCGVNRSRGEANDGTDAEMTASGFLARFSTGARLVPILLDQRVDMRRYLPKGDASTPAETVDHFADMFGLELSDAERQAILDDFLNVSPYFGRGRFAFDPANKVALERELVDRKIAALLVVFSQVPRFHLK